MGIALKKHIVYNRYHGTFLLARRIFVQLKISDLARVALCAAVTAALAWVTIPLPFTPVPMSGQTFGVILSGLVLSPPLAALSQGVYILLGVVGLPVFSGGRAGLGILTGPTGGYIWGFVLGAYIISYLIPNTRSLGFWRYVLAITVGSVAIIYTTGVVQLMVVTKISFIQALTGGVLPFLLGDFIKVLIGAQIGKRLNSFKIN